MKTLGLAVAALIAAPVVAVAQDASDDIVQTPEAVLSYLFTSNFPGGPSKIITGDAPIKYTEKGFIHDDLEIVFDASDPCHPEGAVLTEGREGATVTFDMERFVAMMDFLGSEGTAFMFFSGDECAVDTVRTDGTSVDLCNDGNMINFQTSVLAAAAETGDGEGAGNLRNQRLKLAGEFYKSEYCKAAPAF